MKVNQKNLRSKDLHDYMELDELLYEEQLERQDAKKERRKTQHKNTKKMMRR